MFDITGPEPERERTNDAVPTEVDPANSADPAPDWLIALGEEFLRLARTTPARRFERRPVDWWLPEEVAFDRRGVPATLLDVRSTPNRQLNLPTPSADASSPKAP